MNHLDLIDPLGVSSGMTSESRKEARRKWYLENREACLQYRRRYYLDHRDEILAKDVEKHRSYYLKNKERIRARQKVYDANNKDRTKLTKQAYRLKHLEAIKENGRHYYLANRERLNAKSLAWQRKNPHRHRANHRKSRYGVDAEQFEQMLVLQNGVCAICGKVGDLGVDHDHATDSVRALLCGNCNRGIGLFRDNPELLLKAAEYVSKHKPHHEPCGRS